MQEWIAVIDAAIQGVPEQAMKRRQTVNRVFASRYKEKACLSQLCFVNLLPVCSLKKSKRGELVNL